MQHQTKCLRTKQGCRKLQVNSSVLKCCLKLARDDAEIIQMSADSKLPFHCTASVAWNPNPDYPGPLHWPRWPSANVFNLLICVYTLPSCRYHTTSNITTKYSVYNNLSTLFHKFISYLKVSAFVDNFLRSPKTFPKTFPQCAFSDSISYDKTFLQFKKCGHCLATADRSTGWLSKV